MSSPELQELTASEPLTLDAEYEMQASWRQDEDSKYNIVPIIIFLNPKFNANISHPFSQFLECTFLILDRCKFEQTNDEIASLIGDTNLFLLNDDDENIKRTAEAEIMIAEQTAQGRHLGWESMLLMLSYGHETIGCTHFVAKIGMSNLKSINMFGKMQFVEVSRSQVFEEITYERECNDEWLQWLRQNVEYKPELYTNKNEV